MTISYTVSLIADGKKDSVTITASTPAFAIGAAKVWATKKLKATDIKVTGVVTH